MTGLELVPSERRYEDLPQAAERPAIRVRQQSFFGWESPSNMIDICAKNLLITVCVTGLIVVAGIIIAVGMTTCSVYKFDNNTGDYLYFQSYAPWNMKLHSRHFPPYTRNNLTFGSGYDYARLHTTDGKTLHFKSNGEVSLSGADNRVLEKTSILFFTCYCDYKKGDNTQPPATNTTAVNQYLRGSIDSDPLITEQWFNISNDMLTNKDGSEEPMIEYSNSSFGI